MSTTRRDPYIALDDYTAKHPSDARAMTARQLAALLNADADAGLDEHWRIVRQIDTDRGPRYLVSHLQLPDADHPPLRRGERKLTAGLYPKRMEWTAERIAESWD